MKGKIKNKKKEVKSKNKNADGYCKETTTTTKKNYYKEPEEFTYNQSLVLFRTILTITNLIVS